VGFLQFSKVSLAFGDRDILKDASLRIAPGTRACLAGANGSGKSTMMKIMAGEISADSGERALQKGARVSYLPQSGIVHKGERLRDEAEKAFAAMKALEAEAQQIAARLSDSSEDGGAVSALLRDHQALQERLEDSGYHRREARIQSVLLGLGFGSGDLDRDVGEFSGGWQMRIALAKALLERPDILLLDEPTNYLDIEARAWLQKWLEKFPGGCLLVSHDRYFLDATVNEVYEIFQGTLTRYAGNYSAYEVARRAELESLLRRHAEQQEEIAKTEALIRRFRYKASKAAFAQELVKRLEKMERIEIPENLKKISIAFPPPPRSPRVALEIAGLGKSYGARKVLSALDLSVDSGERLVVAGANGAGKSTLLRILSGADRDFQGSLKLGAGISVGYFSQDAAEALCGDEQVLEFMEARAGFDQIPRLRDMLGAFLFRGDDVHKPVRVLSGGEKSRLALLAMLLRPLNLLILDEPTNHLDLHSKDVLLDALSRFQGTILFVSHDRAFMEALSTKTLELSARESGAARARLFYGNYAYYLEKISADEGAGERAPEESAPKAAPKAQAQDSRSQGKQAKNELRRLERLEARAIEEIDEIEARKAGIEAELSRAEVYSNGEKAKAAKKALEDCALALAEKTREWEALLAQLEAARL